MATEVEERLSIVEEAMFDFKKFASIIIHEMKEDTRRLKENLDEHNSNMEKMSNEHNSNMEKMSNKHNSNMEKLRNELNEKLVQIDREKAEGWIKYKKEANKIRGELSDRIGTLAEDFAYPNVPIIAEKYFGCPDEPNDIFLRRKKMHPVSGKKDKREYDVVAVYDDCVICTGIKYKGKSSDIIQFRKSLDVFFEYYPEYENLRLIPLFASLQLDDSIVNLCSKKGIYCMTLTVETMDIINYDRVSL